MIIEAKNLVKEFGKFRAVDSIAFSIKEGESFGLLGPNGAGKTTTIRMLVGLTHPTSGTASIGGYDCVSQKTDVHRIIGVVFELPTLYVRSSVKMNLNLFAGLFNVSKKRVDDVIARFLLKEVLDKRVDKLSKGWKQRVLIARALLHDPKVLFLDEPTSGLDPNSVNLLRGIIKELKDEGKTIILCTHNMQEADELCDRIGFVYKGRMVALDTPQALKSEDGEKELTIEFVENGKTLTKTYPFNSSEAADLIHRKLPSGEILAINTKELTLADVFTKVTGGDLTV